MIDQYAQLLTTALTEPAALDIGDVVERMDAQTTRNAEQGRAWIAAVRRVQQAGHLSSDDADAFVHHLASSVVEDVVTAELLDSLGETALASTVRREGVEFPERLEERFWELALGDPTDADTKVRYPTWLDDGDDSPRLIVSADALALVEKDFVEKLDLQVWSWRRAVTGEDGWTVDVAIAFAFGGARGIDTPDGALHLLAVQRARDEGVLDENLSWLLFERVAEWIISDELEADEAMQELEERIDLLELEGSGPDDPTMRGNTEGASKAWIVLNDVRERRTSLLKRRVLRAVGEEEMVRAMKERPEEYGRRVEMAAREWEVE